MQDQPPGLKLSRRDLFGATAGLSLSRAQPDGAAFYCTRWLEQNAEVRRLSTLWGDIEADLAANHRWFQLSTDERARRPEGAELTRTEQSLAALIEDRDVLLTRLPLLPARDGAALMAKVLVLRELVDIADHLEAKALITSVLSDLRTIFGNRPLAGPAHPPSTS